MRLVLTGLVQYNPVVAAGGSRILRLRREIAQNRVRLVTRPNPGLWGTLLGILGFEQGLFLSRQFSFQRLAEHIQGAFPPKAPGLF